MWTEKPCFGRKINPSGFEPALFHHYRMILTTKIATVCSCRCWWHIEYFQGLHFFGGKSFSSSRARLFVTKLKYTSEGARMGSVVIEYGRGQEAILWSDVDANYLNRTRNPVISNISSVSPFSFSEVCGDIAAGELSIAALETE
ncbi:hypothetical protein ACFE04_000009 [Oxalis oulophora]